MEEDEAEDQVGIDEGEDDAGEMPRDRRQGRVREYVGGREDSGTAPLARLAPRE